MPNYAPELVASVLHDHEHTDKPLKQIAAEYGVSERDITRMRHAADIPSRRARVRELPDEMREWHEINKQLKAAAPPGADVDVGRNKRGEAEHIAPNDASGAVRSAYCALRPESEHDLRALIARVARLVDQELAAEEATRAKLGRLARKPADLERCARIVASMTRSLRELLRLHAGLAPEQGSNNGNNIPADIDEFRRALAHRIEAILESREADGGVECAAGAGGVDET